MLLTAPLTVTWTAMDSDGLSTGLADSPWPKEGRDQRNTACSPYSTSHNNGELRWTYDVGEQVRGSPVVGKDGTVYFTADDGYLYALTRGGSLKWRLEVNTTYAGPAIGSDGTVYVQTAFMGLYAFNPDGTILWKTPEGPHYTHTAIAIGKGGDIYVGKFTGQFVAWGPDSTESWNLSFDYPLRDLLPAIDGAGNLIMANDEESILSKYDRNGKDVWDANIAGRAIGATAMAKDGTIYVAAYTYSLSEGNICAHDSTGSEKWTCEIGNSPVSSPAIGPDGTVYVLARDSKLYATSPEGSHRWSVAIDKWTYSSPVVGADGTVYVGSRNGTLYAISEKGKVKWTFKMGGSIGTTPAIDSDGILYFGSDDGKFYAVGRERTLLNAVGWLWVPIIAVPAILIGILVLLRRRRRAKGTPGGKAPGRAEVKRQKEEYDRLYGGDLGSRPDR